MSGKEEGGGGTGRRLKQDTKLRSIGCISNRGLSQEKKQLEIRKEKKAKRKNSKGLNSQFMEVIQTSQSIWKDTHHYYSLHLEDSN